MQEMIKRAKELLADGTVVRVLGWKRCDLPYNPEPAFFGTEKELDALVYDGFCGANLSKYMIEAGKKEGRTLVFLKPCDTYSFNQLVKEHRIDREKAYIIGVGCRGKLDIEAIKGLGIKGIETVEEDGDTLKIGTIYGDKTCAYGDAVMERCKVCKGTEHMVYDELIGADVPHLGVSADQRRSSGNLQKLLRIRNRHQTVFQNKGIKARGKKAQRNRLSFSGYTPAVSTARTD